MKKMALFNGLQIALDLSYSLNFKKKSELRKQIVENGGTISYIVTRKCQFVVTSDPEKCDVSTKCRMALKYRLPVLKLDYIWDCLKACKLLPKESYVVGGKSKFLDFKSGKITAAEETEKPKKFGNRSVFSPRSVKTWLAEDQSQPHFNDMTFEVAKYAIYLGHNKVTKYQVAYILELHTPPGVRGNPNLDDTMEVDRPVEQPLYRITLQTGNQKDLEAGRSGHIEHRYVTSADQALAVYAMLYEDLEKKPDVVKYVGHLRGLGSQKLQKLLAEVIHVHDHCSDEVKHLVEHIWQEAMAEVTTTLGDISAIRLEQVEKAEAVLLKIRDAIKSANSTAKFEDLVTEFYSLLHHTNEKSFVSEPERKRWLARKQDMCQLIKDMISVSELTDYQTRAYVEAKYAALRCRITHLDGDKREEVEELVKSSVDNLSILHVYEVWRQVEDLDFRHDIEPKSLLFHSSKVENFVGILSRGLLLPKVVVDDFGGKRSDVGMLGSGIYFASAASTSVKYSSPSNSKGTRLLLINEVALGHSKEYLDYALDLVAPPGGYDSTHGVSKQWNKSSKFENDEYVVYAANQQRLRYLVEFTLAEDKVKTVVEAAADVDSDILCETIESTSKSVSINDVTDIADPMSKVKPGLIGNGDVNVELRGVHIRAKLVDLAAQVVVLQEYYNNSHRAIEAKYVFPLDDTAAVCGFEAFINGKHIIGEVKEKEVAHKEYKKAISEGHGAYLMDQDKETPDVFTVSVGNLPPYSCVLIKITYVAELQVEDEKISFRLPAAVAPWKEDSALKNSTQEELKSFKMAAAKTTVQVSVEMPFEIRSLHCPTHKIRVKQTASKAYVEMARLQKFGSGFQLLIGLAEIHVPRMWVERHPGKSQHQACMLTFFPEFESAEITEGEIVLALDVSNSMKGDPLIQARKVALLVLKFIPVGWHFNVVRFGSDFDELFPAPKLNTEGNLKDASIFIQNSSANKGNTDVLRPLRSLFLLPTSHSQRNVFLISDGHINNEEIVIRSARLNSSHNRVFSFGVSATCNSYTLKALSRVSGGSFEFFNTKTKSKWEPKVKTQINKASQPGLTAVAVEWRQYDDNLPPPVQAPRQITAMFNGSRQVIYGYVPNCTMATLTASVGGQQASTVVSTSELSITEGHLVHRLTARAVIRDWEDGVLSSDRTGHELAKMDMKNYIIDLSKEYSIVTQFTSFIAVEKREENEKETLPSGPKIQELVDQENVDILQYMGWTKSLEGDDIPLDSLLQDLRTEIEQNNLSNRMLSRLPAIEEKKLLLREQFGPCNKEMLLTSKLLMEAYMLQTDKAKAADLAVETFNECMGSIQPLYDSEVYIELAEILSDIRTKAVTMPDVKDKLRPTRIPLPVMSQGKVLLKTLTGKEISIPSTSHISVMEFKNLVERADGTPVSQQRLIFNGCQLEDSCSLEDYSIGYGDTVHLVQRLRGGGEPETRGLLDALGYQRSGILRSGLLAKSASRRTAVTQFYQVSSTRKESLPKSGTGTEYSEVSSRRNKRDLFPAAEPREDSYTRQIVWEEKAKARVPEPQRVRLSKEALDSGLSLESHRSRRDVNALCMGYERMSSESAEQDIDFDSLLESLDYSYDDASSQDFFLDDVLLTSTEEQAPMKKSKKGKKIYGMGIKLDSTAQPPAESAEPDIDLFSETQAFQSLDDESAEPDIYLCRETKAFQSLDDDKQKTSRLAKTSAEEEDDASYAAQDFFLDDVLQISNRWIKADQTAQPPAVSVYAFDVSSHEKERKAASAAVDQSDHCRTSVTYEDQEKDQESSTWSNNMYKSLVGVREKSQDRIYRPAFAKSKASYKPPSLAASLTQRSQILPTQTSSPMSYMSPLQTRASCSLEIAPPPLRSTLATLPLNIHVPPPPPPPGGGPPPPPPSGSCPPPPPPPGFCPPPPTARMWALPPPPSAGFGFVLPAPGSVAPGFGSEPPSAGSFAPRFGGGPPTAGSFVPSFGDGPPTAGSFVPSFGGGPTAGSFVPSFGGGPPTAGSIALNFGSEPPTAGSFAPSFGSGPPTVGSFALGFGSGPPTVGSTAPCFGGGLPTVGSIFPGFKAGPPTVGSFASCFGSGPPTARGTALGFGSSPPTANSIALDFGSGPPTADSTASGFGYGPTAVVSVASIFAGRSSSDNSDSELEESDSFSVYQQSPPEVIDLAHQTCGEKTPEKGLPSSEPLFTFGIGAKLTSIRTREDTLKSEDLVKLMELQQKDGGWNLNSELDQLIGIDSAALEAILYSSGLSSLGATAEGKIRSYLAMLLVLFSFLELVHFDVDVEKFVSKHFSEDDIIALGSKLELAVEACEWDEDQLHALSEAFEKMFKFHDEFTSRHPLVYSTLELGKSWADVVNKLMTPPGYFFL
ncbi:unnamed protein product [Lymnaea stagnalis]|uniref:Poly [ADP-ribose] polymerase n=1 Tax=Lymnaea stagnalis TaxID=6523 RepID=A0AAV2HWY9_LYMST